MKKIERFTLIDKIGRELQSKMTYSDINGYLQSFKINTSKQTSGTNSKWVYVKELLADISDELVLEIADDLGMSPQTEDIDLSDTDFWIPGYLRLFISHKSNPDIKVKVGYLQKALLEYGISCFVAHEDIKPTKVWQQEIEKALFSMDALAAILSEGFKESDWTDQEVGVALGRNITVIPVIKDIHPYGLFGKFQGVKTSNKNVGDTAKDIFKILTENKKTRPKMLASIAEKLLLSKNKEKAKFYLEILKNLSLPEEILNKIYSNALNNDVLKDIVTELNNFFQPYGYPKFEAETDEKDLITMDDLPF